MELLFKHIENDVMEFKILLQNMDSEFVIVQGVRRGDIINFRNARAF